MEAIPVFEYRRLGDFTYHILTDPLEIRRHLRKRILREWELDHNQAPHEHWTVEWLALLPKMEFSLEIVLLDEIPNEMIANRLTDKNFATKITAEDAVQYAKQGATVIAAAPNANGPGHVAVVAPVDMILVVVWGVMCQTSST